MGHTQLVMNAEPMLVAVATAMADARLEAVMVGNAAASLRGAPVTTLDKESEKALIDQIHRLLALP